VCNMGESSGVFEWPTKMGEILFAIRWGNSVVHSQRWDCGCNVGKSDGVFKWPTKMGVILSAILMNWVGYLSD
jgi:hypothetical protein